MSYIFYQNNIRIFFLLFAIFIVKVSGENRYITQQLKLYTVNVCYWNLNESYIFYIDVSHFKLGQETIIQIISESNYFINNLSISEIDESYIDKNDSEIIIKEKYSKIKHVKLRQKPKAYYFEILIKKYFKEQKYFTILVEPYIVQNNTEVTIMVSSTVQEKKIEKESISDGNIYIQEYGMDTKRERFYKFIFNDIDFQKSNLILFVADKGVSTFYINNITSIGRKTGLYIIPKNSTQENDFIIYLSLLGPANKTKFQIMLDDEHDIIYRYGVERLFTSLFIERLNCTKDIYIFEDYSSINNDDYNHIFHLDVNSIYGDYELIYYENIASNITNIFRADNYTKKILNEISVNRLNGDSNVLKLSCKKPTLIRLRYLKENIKLSINEGQEIIVHLDKLEKYYDVYSGNFRINEKNKHYIFYFSYYKLEEASSKSVSTLSTSFKGYFNNYDLTKDNPFYIGNIYTDKISNYKTFTVDVNKDNLYFRLYLITNQFYKNVIEGVTKINLEEKSIAFKIRKDIIFDYFIFKAYSYNKSNPISIEYDLKIVEKSNIDKDKVMLGMDPVKYYLHPEIIIRYSNPYDKFNSNIKEDDYVYLLAKFTTNINYFPIYVDIRYYCNNTVVTLKSSQPEILVNNKEYKIYGNKNSEKFDKILININKCNCSKNYSMKTFYENNENLILEENIINDRTFLFHDNLFNYTKLIFNYDNNNDVNNKEIFNDIDIQNKDLHLASYYRNGDIYMNYFPLNKYFYNKLEITKNFSISYEEGYTSVLFKWENYLLNNMNEYAVNYSIYILPKKSPINSICQMSLIPPNISLINKNNYEHSLDKGEYKISIIASIVDEDLPLTTYYDFLEFEIHRKFNLKLIIIVSSSSLALIALIIIIIICCKKCKNETEINLDNIEIRKKSRLISVVKALGIGDEQEGIILGMDEDDEVENIINKQDGLKEKEEENNFSILSDK